VLWQGPPGTGKTNALRALIWEWRDRVATHYVTDPEVLLSDPGYLHAVLLGSAGGREQWRLIVLEDAGELLAPDAKERAGQGLARLLNLTDGLIGQGLKVIVLITGNEPLERLHPAVSRPGRCAARIEFRRFDAPQAVEWLERHDAPPVEASATLADLYALLEGRPSLAEPVFGFGRESLGAHD
jgi:SpoVK/Ycf46/Vps4 family AAA+-type ATPase